MKELRSIFEMADCNLVDEQECMVHACGPYDSQQRQRLGEGKDWVQEMAMPLPPPLLPRRTR